MIIIDLIYNLSVLVAVSIVSGFIDYRYSRDKILGRIIQGILFGFVSFIGMKFPFVLTTGIIFDGRSIVISLCSLFFGPLSGLIAALFAAAYRFYIGGGGLLMGELVIFSSFIVGLLFFNRLKYQRRIRIVQLYILGLIVHTLMIILMLTLPSKFIGDTFRTVAPTVILIYPIITVVIGKILSDQLEKSKLFEEITEKELLYRTTLYSIGDAVITTDSDGLIQNMNSVAENLTGYSENEVRGKNLKKIFKIFNEETKKEVENPVEVVLKSNTVVSLANHTVLINKNGIEIPIADSGAPIRDDSGNIIGVVLVFRDQTKERQAKKILRDSEKRFRTLYENAPIAYQSLDQTGKILEVNKAWLEMLGYEYNEVINKSITEFLTEDSIRTLMEKFPKFLSSGEIYAAEFNLKRKDNSVVIVSVDGRLGYDITGKYKQTHCVLHNISESRHYESAIKKKANDLASLLKVSLKLIETVDKDAVLQNIVESAVELLSLDSGAIYTIDGEDLFIEAVIPKLPQEIPFEFRKAFLPNHPHIKEAAVKKDIVIIENTQFAELSEYERIIVNERGLKTLLYIPLLIEKETIGVLILGTIGKVRDFDEDEFNLARTLSAFASVALENAYLFRDLKFNLMELENSIKERDAIQKELIKSEEKFRNLAENANDLIYRYEFYPERKFTYVSPSSTRITGYSPEEHYADPDLGLKLIHPDDVKLLTQMSKGGKIPDKPVILRWLRKDGSVLWVEQKNVPIYDEKNNLIAVEGISRDITDEQKAKIIQEIQYNIADGVIKSKDINDFLTLVRLELSKFIDSKNFFVAFYDEEKGLLRSDIEMDEKDSIEEWPAERSLTGQIIKHKKPLMLSKDEIISLNENGEIDLIGTVPEIWLGAPLQIDDKVFGAIVVQNYSNKNIYDLSSLDFLELIANQISFYIGKKKTENDIVLREYRYRMLFDLSPSGIVLENMEGKILEVNDAFCKSLGYSRDELIGKYTRDIASEEFIDLIESNIERLKKGEVLEQVVRNIKKDGSTCSLELRESMIVLGDSEFGILGIANDVTEKLKYQEELQASEKLFRTLAETTSTAIFVYQGTKFVYSNKAAQQISGYSEEEFLQKNFWDFIHPEYHEIVKQRGLARLRGENVPDNYEFKIICKDGSEKWLDFTAGLITWQGKVSAIGTAFDITKRKLLEIALKEREEKYRLISNLTSDYLFETKLNENNEIELYWVSGSFEKITGYNLEDYKKAGGWRGLLHPDDLEKDVQAFNQLCQNKPVSVEVRTFHKNGDIVWVRSSGHPIWDYNKNKLIGILGAVTDISENKKMMEQLVVAREKAEKSDSLKSEFLAQMSHEIRSPLNIILNFVSLIKEEIYDKIDDDLKTGFESINSAGRRIIRTIDLILNMSDVQLGTYEVVIRKFDIIEILNRINLEYQPTANVKGIKLSLNSEIASKEIASDEYAVSQIISNLVDNAIKYTKKGSVEIHSFINNNSKLQIDIIDTGIGISEEFLPTLFSPFTQEEHGYTRSYEGNGLGLALVKRYCDLINTEISVSSKKGKGSIFSLIFN